MSIRKSSSFLLPFTLFLFSFLLRLSLISKGPYHLDCLNLAVLAERTLETGSLQNQFGSGYPLTVLFGALFIFVSRIFSQNDPVFAVNLMSVVFSSLAIPALYAVSNKLFGRLAAFLSSILFSVSPIFLGISVYGKSHTPSIFFLLTGLYFLLSFLETHDRKLLLISGVFIGSMGAARLQDMILMTVPISFLCIFGTTAVQSRPLKEKFENLFIFWVTAFVIVAGFHLPYLIQKDHVHYLDNLSIFWQQGAAINFRGFFSQSLIASFVFLLINFTEAGLMIAVIGLSFMAQKSRRLLIFLLLLIGLPLLFYGNLYSSVPRFFAFILPPFILAQGYLFARSVKINATFRVISLAVYCTILYLMFTFIFPLVYARHAYALLPDYAKWVSEKIEKNAYFITTDDRPFYIHYGQFNFLFRPIDSFHLEDTVLADFKREIDELLDNDIPVYTTSVGLFAYDPRRKYSSLIMNNYDLEIVGTKLFEDWHRGVLKQMIFYNPLIRLKKKAPGSNDPSSILGLFLLSRHCFPVNPISHSNYL